MKNLKKTLAVILAILMISAIPVTAFAAPHSGTPLENSWHYGYDKTAEYYSYDEPLWDYDPETHQYVDENGKVWEYRQFYMFGNDPFSTPKENRKNGIVGKGEGYSYFYRILEDGTIAVSILIEFGINNFKIPATIDGRKVTVIDDFRTDYNGADPYGYEGHILSITVPEGVREIGHNAFHNNNCIERIVIPSSVEVISVGAFSLNATGGIDIYYTGSEEQWNKIITWHPSTDIVPAWAVTGYDWTRPYESGIDLGNAEGDVKELKFNVNPEEIEPLVPEMPEEIRMSPIERFFRMLIEYLATLWAEFTEKFFGAGK